MMGETYGLGGKRLALFDRLFDGPDHVDAAYRQMIVLALDQSFKPLMVSASHEHTGQACEHLGDVHWLRQEPLDLAGTRDGEFVLADSSSLLRMSMPERS